MSQEQDLTQLQIVVKGDTASFSYFIQKYQDMVYGIALSIVVDPLDAQIVTQDTFVRLYKHLESYRKGSKFSTWLYRIAVNAGLAHLRRTKQKKIIPIEHIPDNPSAQTFNEGEKILDQQQLKKNIADTLDQMKPKERLILELYYLQEFNLKEIVEITGFTRNYIKVLLHRGREHFETLYHKTYGQI